MLLSADRGQCREKELQGSKGPGIAKHGSFSLGVNFHAIGQYVANRGGTALQPGHRHSSLIVSAFLLGNPPTDHAETRQAYKEAIEAFGPDDFFTLKKGIQKVCGNFSIEQVLAFLRLSGWDAKTLITFFPTLMKRLENANDDQRHEIYSSIHRVWDTYYPMGESSTDLSFHLGTLLCKMGYYREALGFYHDSLKHYGKAPGTEYNIAYCHDGLREPEKALEHVHKALELDPDFEPARALRIQIEGAMGSGKQG